MPATLTPLTYAQKLDDCWTMRQRALADLKCRDGEQNRKRYALVMQMLDAVLDDRPRGGA